MIFPYAVLPGKHMIYKVGFHSISTHGDILKRKPPFGGFLLWSYVNYVLKNAAPPFPRHAKEIQANC